MSDTDRCPAESAHDYVVIQMASGADLRCLYTVECARCGSRATGYADEIPPSRFAGGEGLV